MSEGASLDVPEYTLPVQGKVHVPEYTLPVQGKVQKLRQQWTIQEDGALAHHLQGKEYDRHFDRNRLYRRTARQDIPVDKLSLKDEEIRQRKDRSAEAFRTQADADDELKPKHEPHKLSSELTDEEYARALQEKERQGRKRFLQKKLKKEGGDERRHVGQASVMTDDLQEGVGDLHLYGRGENKRVTPSSTIENGGDSSDLPEHLDPALRQALQEMQDEELARRLQEQEQRGSAKRGGRGRHGHHRHLQPAGEHRHRSPTDPAEYAGRGAGHLASGAETQDN